MQKWWFKAFIWFSSSAFFFIASAIIISVFNPQPDEKSIMSFMSGMMSAMHGSTMGYSMTLEEDSVLKNIILLSSEITIPLIAIAILCGILFKVFRHND